MDLREYVYMLGRRWRLIALVLLCILGINLIITLRAEPVYQSQTRLFISTPDLLRTDPLQAQSFAIQRATTYVDLANGDELASRVVSQLKLKMAPSAFATKITAVAVPETVILVISATDSDPRVAQEYSQITAQELIEFVQEIESPAGKQKPALKVTIVTSADLPTSPISPRPVRNFVLALLVGLLLGVGAAHVWEQIYWKSPSRRPSSGDVDSPGRAPSPLPEPNLSPDAGTERDSRVAKAQVVADEAANEDRLGMAVQSLVNRLRKSPGEEFSWNQVKPSHRARLGLDTQEIVEAARKEEGVEIEERDHHGRVAYTLSWTPDGT